MKLERLFNVLVLGGAAQFTGCADDAADPSGSQGQAREGGADSGMLGSGGSGGSQEQSGPANDNGSDGDTGGGDEGTPVLTDGGPAAVDAGLGPMMIDVGPLDCTEGASNPGDGLGVACGCECCWSPGNPNTDPQNCAGFCGDCCDS